MRDVQKNVCLGVVLHMGLAVLLSGCAGYSIDKDGQGCGYDVYGPAPYLLGTPTLSKPANGDKPQLHYTFEVVYLPDFSRRYRIRSWAGFGKADFTFAFNNGWMLTSVMDKSSNEKVLEQLTGLAKQMLPTDPWKSIDGDTSPTTAAVAMDPVLYWIEFDRQGRPVCLKKLDLGETDCPDVRRAVPCTR